MKRTLPRLIALDKELYAQKKELDAVTVGLICLATGYVVGITHILIGVFC